MSKEVKIGKVDDFFEHLNSILSNYNCQFLNKEIACSDSQKNNQKMEFNFGFGTFLEQFQMNSSTSTGSFEQYSILKSFYLNLQGAYKKYYNHDFFIKCGINIFYYNTKIWSQKINSLPINPRISNLYKNINSSQPIATSTILIPEVSVTWGNTFKISKNFLINLDAGFSVGKMVFAKSKADLAINKTKHYIITNKSYFADNNILTFSLISNPNIELGNKIKTQIGLLITSGISWMNPTENYQLVSANEYYTALESATKTIFLGNLGLSFGITYNL